MNNTICDCGVVLKDSTSIYVTCTCGMKWKYNLEKEYYIKLTDDKS